MNYKGFRAVQEEESKVSSPKRKPQGGATTINHASSSNALSPRRTETVNSKPATAFSGDGGWIEYDPIRGWLRGVEVEDTSLKGAPKAMTRGASVAFKPSTVRVGNTLLKARRVLKPCLNALVLSRPWMV